MITKAVIKEITIKGRAAMDQAYKENLKVGFINRKLSAGVWRFDRSNEDPLIIEMILNPKFKTFIHKDTLKENVVLALEKNGAAENVDYTIEVL